MTKTRSIPRTLVVLSILASAAGCTGSRGAPGPQGTPGPAGAPGPQGVTGSPGVTGQQSQSAAVPATPAAIAMKNPVQAAQLPQAITQVAAGGISGTHGGVAVANPAVQTANPAPTLAPGALPATTILNAAPAKAIAKTQTQTQVAPPPTQAAAATTPTTTQTGTPKPVRKADAQQILKGTVGDPGAGGDGAAASGDGAAANGSGDSAAADSDCSDVKIDETFFGLPRDQGGMGLCYAYSSADMLTYCMNESKGAIVYAHRDPNTHQVVDDKTGQEVNDSMDSGKLVWRSDVLAVDGKTKEPDLTLRERVSALDLGFNYDYSNFNVSTARYVAGAIENGGGDQRASMNAVISKGVCLENNMTSDAFVYDQKREEKGEKPVDDTTKDVVPTATLINKMLGLKVIWDASVKATGDGLFACKEGAVKFPWDDPATALADPDAKSCSADEPRFGHLGQDNPKVFSNEAFQALISDPNTTDGNVLAKLDDLICPANKRVKVPSSCTQVNELIAKYDGGPDKLLAAIDARLAKKLPVGIGVYAHFLHAKNDSDKPLVAQAQGGSLESEGGHAMVIVGRTMRNGKCEYRVRNSWARSCYMRYTNGAYTKSSDDPLYGQYVDCQEGDGGYIYLRRDYLQSALNSVSWVGN